MSDCTEKQGSTERFFLRGVKTRTFKKKKNRTCFHSTCVNLVLISTCCCVKSGPNNQARNDVKGTGTLLTVAGVSLPNCPPPPLPSPSEAAQLPWCLNRWLKGKDDNVHIVSVWESEIMRSKRECLMSVCMILFCVSVQREKIIYIFFKKTKAELLFKTIKIIITIIIIMRVRSRKESSTCKEISKSAHSLP